jgi:hypothetical protein
MTITPEEVIAAISAAEAVLDLALPAIGQPGFVPVEIAAGELAKKLVTLVSQRALQTASQAAKAAIDVEVDAAEAAKFPKAQ